MFPFQQSNLRRMGLAVLALMGAIAQIPILEMLGVPNIGIAGLYGGGFKGLALVILSLGGPAAMLVGWVVACVRLWRNQRTGFWILRSLCSIDLAISSVALTKMWLNWDSFNRWAAASAPLPQDALLDYRNRILLYVALVIVYAVALGYSVVAVRPAKPIHRRERESAI
jgi:hypothetical protein